MLDYCSAPKENWNNGCKIMIQHMMASHANTVIFPIQDILVFGADTRMNTPGTSGANWQYRITEKQLSEIDWGHFRYLNGLYCRLPKK